MCDARRKPQNDGRIVFFRKFERERREIGGFLRIARFQNGTFRADRSQARILLVLRTEYGRIVRDGHYQPRVYARIDCGEKRIGGDVESDVFHGNDGSRPFQRGAVSDFKRHFFVRRPLAVNVVIPCEFFRDLGRRRSGVGGCHPHAPFVCAACHGEISQQ